MALEKILVVDDTPIISRSLAERLRAKRFSVSTAGTVEEAEKLLAKNHFDLMFLDVDLPDGDGREFIDRISEFEHRPIVVMITANDTINAVVACMRAGAFDYLTKPFSLSQIDLVVKKAAEHQHSERVTDFLNRESIVSHKLLGESKPVRNLQELVKRVGRTDATVMICGESGTGKELVANEIFLSSQRGKRPFIKVNCAAISEKLIESEFFGHERGAFTGATEQRDGRFELANTGTILLDEVSEISLPLQAKLLRVLQEREFERVGGNKTIKVDVRVLATTNRDLLKSVENGDFREDLYYRLNVFPIQVPPLRERGTDVKLLAEKFLERVTRQHGTRCAGFSESGMDALLAHQWPGNVRELQNVVERAAILVEDGKSIDADLLGLRRSPTVPIASAAGGATLAAESPSAAASLEGNVLPLHEVEKRCIFEALDRTGGNRTQAAALLKISIRTLRNKLSEYRDVPADPAV